LNNNDFPPKKDTDQENKIAEALDEFGIRYTQQEPIGPYFADFWIEDIGMVIEADGPYGHLNKRDAKRDKDLKELGVVEVFHTAQTSRKHIRRELWEALTKLPKTEEEIMLENLQ